MPKPVEDVPPLVVDIDGTLTGPDRAVHLGAFEVLRAWNAPVVVATGKAFPYPVALCEFVGIEPCVIAENGGVVFVGQTEELIYGGDPDAATAVAEAYRDQVGDLGWGPIDLANRWRETEIAVNRSKPIEPLQELAKEFGQVVVDTGFAYHVKAPDVDKGTGLQAVADELDRSTEDFLAVGDSENDAPTFELAGESVAVANADDTAKAAADWQTGSSYGEGFLEALQPYLEE